MRLRGKRDSIRMVPPAWTLAAFGPRPCENPANFCKQSRRAKFFAIFSLPSGLRARKSEQNRSVSKRVGVFTQARPFADLPDQPRTAGEPQKAAVGGMRQTRPTAVIR